MPTEQYMPFYVRLNESRVYICWIQTCTTLPLSLPDWLPGQFRLLNTTLDFVMTRSLASLAICCLVDGWLAGFCVASMPDDSNCWLLLLLLLGSPDDSLTCVGTMVGVLLPPTRMIMPMPMRWLAGWLAGWLCGSTTTTMMMTMTLVCYGCCFWWFHTFFLLLPSSSTSFAWPLNMLTLLASYVYHANFAPLSRVIS